MRAIIPLLCVIALNAESQELWKSAESAARSTKEHAMALSYELDSDRLSALLEDPSSTSTLSIPLADGQFSEFSITRSPLLHPALAAKFPEIQVFQGTNGQGHKIRLDYNGEFLHAIIFQGTHIIYLDPIPGEANVYQSYDAAAFLSDKEFNQIKGESPIKKMVELSI